MNLSVSNTDGVPTTMPLVFVVDDEKTIADTLAVILRIAGFEAEAFYKPEAALQRTQECTPDVLLSDVVMPEMDGYTLAYVMRRKCPRCRMLLFSGNATAAQYRCVSAQDSGMGDIEVLSKPIPPASLIEHIRSLLCDSKSN